MFILSVLFFSCSDDNTIPITLKDKEGTTIRLTYLNENEYSFPLQGGDGNYSVKSNDDKVVKAKMISAIDFRLTIIAVGETTVSITDNSQNTLVLNVVVDYLTNKFVIVKHNIEIVGGDLTENEKQAIKEKYLAEIPVKVGGGYKFIYTDVFNESKAVIYPDTYGDKGIETTFTIKELENVEGVKAGAYEVAIQEEKRVFVLQRYYPSTKMTVSYPVALIEDITKKVQTEYPKAELVFTSQVVDIPKE
ncbi:MAG: hypothetical protein ACK5M3_00795 [Dysgonomonas sp.]